jgi:uncharacterized membrane protein YdjX (TVP38/TMEM64 family)
MRIYIGCLIALGAMWFYVLSNAPPPPAIEECDNFGFYAVITVGKDPTALTRMIKCAQAYQKFNWWFVVCTFFLTYIGIKMFAIPAVFPLGILGGAIFPFWLSLGLTGSGEALGNSLCYLMSASIAQPVLERLFPQKLAKVAQKAEEEKVSGRRHRHLHRHRHHLHRHHLHHQENWLLFNFFLRLTPFVPNWFVNLSSPIVGNPIKPFIIGSFFGTQARRHAATPTCARPALRPSRARPPRASCAMRQVPCVAAAFQFSLFFLALCGNTLATLGEEAYADIRSPLALLADPRKYAHIIIVGAVGVASQAVPMYIIRKRKQAKAEATGKRRKQI